MADKVDAFQGACIWDASLSTMWGVRNFPHLEDALIATQRLGFARVELNHQVNSAMLEGIDFKRYPVSSLHEPCPADIPTATLAARDWLISSSDEERRGQGVAVIKKSIDLARDLGVREVVVHAGNVGVLLPKEADLIALYKAGRSESVEYQELKSGIENARALQAGPRLAAAQKSLLELMAYAGGAHVRLGLENRYHYPDIPSPDELEALLSLADPDRLGFVYDTGHGQALENLGFYPHAEWLRRFHSRIVGVHLHDISGISDHAAPGSGEIDFEEVAGFLPPGAFRTCELRAGTNPGQIITGMEYLVKKGCIRCL